MAHAKHIFSKHPSSKSMNRIKTATTPSITNKRPRPMNEKTSKANTSKRPIYNGGSITLSDLHYQFLMSIQMFITLKDASRLSRVCKLLGYSTTAWFNHHFHRLCIHCHELRMYGYPICRRHWYLKTHGNSEDSPIVLD